MKAILPALIRIIVQVFYIGCSLFLKFMNKFLSYKFAPFVSYDKIPLLSTILLILAIAFLSKHFFWTNSPLSVLNGSISWKAMMPLSVRFSVSMFAILFLFSFLFWLVSFLIPFGIWFCVCVGFFACSTVLMLSHLCFFVNSAYAIFLQIVKFNRGQNALEKYKKYFHYPIRIVEIYITDRLN